MRNLTYTEKSFYATQKIETIKRVIRQIFEFQKINQRFIVFPLNPRKKNISREILGKVQAEAVKEDKPGGLKRTHKAWVLCK